MPLDRVTIYEINRIFEITDELLIDREHLEIPLRPSDPGGVEKRDGIYHITVPASADFDAWLDELEEKLEGMV